MKKYYGQWEIVAEKPTVNPYTNEVLDGYITLEFAPYKDANNFEQTPPAIVIPEFAQEALTSKRPTDWTAHRDLRLKPIAEEILRIMRKYNIGIGAGPGIPQDFQYVADLIAESLGRQRMYVEDQLWGAEERYKSILQLDNLMKYYTKDLPEIPSGA